MTASELTVKTNHYLIKGGALTLAQKNNVVSQLLAARSSPETARRFYSGVKFPGNTDASGRRMYPEFFIPPFNGGKKLKTVFGQTPATHILSANAYELELLRLLVLFAPENPNVCDMAARTLSRLKTTCFGNADDGVGECYDSSLVVLRFLASAAPGETDWIKKRIAVFHNHYGERHRVWQVKRYFWLCLQELPPDIALPEIARFKDEILTQLNRAYVMNSEFDREYHPVIICAARNTLARLPEFGYISGRQPYVSDKDGRLHFNMQKT